jgi:hypothetical protein
VEEEQLHVVHHIITNGVGAVHGEEEVVFGLPATDHASVSASVSLLVQPCEERLERQLLGDAFVLEFASHLGPQMTQVPVLVTAGSQLGVVASSLGGEGGLARISDDCEQLLANVRGLGLVEKVAGDAAGSELLGFVESFQLGHSVVNGKLTRMSVNISKI